MQRQSKVINLSWLVEKWTIWEDPYLKNIWLNIESLDLIRIMQDVDSSEGLEENYIDIENNPEEYVCMPGKEAINQKLALEVFADRLDQATRDQIYENYNELAPIEEFLDVIYEQGLEHELNDFRSKVAAKILWEWAHEENLKVRKDIDFIDLYNRNI